MTNFSDAVDQLWGWMRLGYTVDGPGMNTPCLTPGRTAAALHDQPGKDGRSQWEGLFRRLYLNDKQKRDYPELYPIVAPY